MSDFNSRSTNEDPGYNTEGSTLVQSLEHSGDATRPVISQYQYERRREEKESGSSGNFANNEELDKKVVDLKPIRHKIPAPPLIRETETYEQKYKAEMQEKIRRQSVEKMIIRRKSLIWRTIHSICFQSVPFISRPADEYLKDYDYDFFHNFNIFGSPPGSKPADVDPENPASFKPEPTTSTSDKKPVVSKGCSWSDDEDKKPLMRNLKNEEVETGKDKIKVDTTEDDSNSDVQIQTEKRRRRRRSASPSLIAPNQKPFKNPKKKIKMDVVTAGGEGEGDGCGKKEEDNLPDLEANQD